TSPLYSTALSVIAVCLFDSPPSFASRGGLRRGVRFSGPWYNDTGGACCIMTLLPERGRVLPQQGTCTYRFDSGNCTTRPFNARQPPAGRVYPHCFRQCLP